MATGNDVTIEVTEEQFKAGLNRIYLRYQVIGNDEVLIGAEASATKSKAELSIDADNFWQAASTSQLAGIFNGRSKATVTFDQNGNVKAVQ